MKYKTKIVVKIPERPVQPGNAGDANRPPQPAVPTLNYEVTFQLKYLNNFMEISWFTIDKLWNRTWFDMIKRHCIDRTS